MGKIIQVKDKGKVATLGLKPMIITTNVNYLGSNDEADYYYSPFGDKTIDKKEYKDLEEGIYKATIVQTYTKEYTNKEGIKRVIKLVELKVDGIEDRFVDVSFLIEGYSEGQMRIANAKVAELCENFKIITWDGVRNLPCKLTCKHNKVGDKVFVNYHIYPVEDNLPQLPLGDHPCKVVKCEYKEKLAIFTVEAKVITDDDRLLKYTIPVKYWHGDDKPDFGGGNFGKSNTEKIEYIKWKLEHPDTFKGIKLHVTYSKKTNKQYFEIKFDNIRKFK